MEKYQGEVGQISRVRGFSLNRCSGFFAQTGLRRPRAGCRWEESAEEPG